MWSGQHEPGKALPLLLYAMSKLSDIGKVYLSVLGTGPKTKNWKNLAESLSLNNIKCYGRLSYEDAIQTMKNADVFVHTSFREATSRVYFSIPPPSIKCLTTRKEIFILRLPPDGDPDRHLHEENSHHRHASLQET